MSQTDNSESKTESHVKLGKPGKTGLKNPFVKVLVSVVAIVAILFGIHYWRYASSHVSTDDAYLTADIITIAPQVSGTVQHVYVKDNQHVEAGQLIVVLDDSTYKTAVQQAEANLEAAVAAAEASGVNVGLTGDTGNAQIQQSEAGVNQAESAVASSEADVYRVKALVGQSSANAQSVKANIATTKASVVSAHAQKMRANAAVEAASSLVETAEADVRSAGAEVESAEAVYTKAANDNKRYQKLLSDNVIGAQAAEQASVGERTAKSQLQTAKEHLSSAKSALNARQADLRAAKEQVTATNAAIEQAQAQYSAAKQQYTAAVAGVTQAQAQLLATSKAVHQSQARHQQALAQLTQARTAPQQVKMSVAAEHQAKARVSQARAALVDAKLRLSYTRIVAPVSGIVSKRSVNEGILVQPGTPLMAIVPPPSKNIWVVANFKETQLANVKAGQSAEIKVDALPGKPFKAKVDSVASGTGATFALLPPDNATGNFTKVVQRIPVKLLIDSDQSNINRLHSGMSVTAIIATR
ncbi:biotin/lipoyl-binding protein [bacterium]|nr:biotin/lipoyl-binding protein [bacterium]